mgnify:CR=1 FL=1
MFPSSCKFILGTGLSGSGKSIALNALEDAGYNCIDNLPVGLLATLVEDLASRPPEKRQDTAVGIDARGLDAELNRVPTLLKTLQAQDIGGEILFLDADSPTLIRRFSETRRRHPLTRQQQDLEAAITQERTLLAPLQDHAQLQIDTSQTTPHELRHMVCDRVAGRATGQLSLLLQSFGFKQGAPRNADFVFDVRCLPNPYWQAELRPLNGLDPAVIAFLQSQENVMLMQQQIRDFIQHWLPFFEKEGRSYVTIAIGCTGGQHRSVYLVEGLRQHFAAQDWQVLGSHRELA